MLSSQERLDEHETASLPRLTAPSSCDVASELLTCSLLVAVITSMVTGKATGRATKLAAPIDTYFPRVLSSLSRSIELQPSQFFDRQLTRSLHDIQTSLTLALEQTPVAAARWLEPSAAGDANWRELSDRWQALCGSIRMLLLVIGDQQWLDDPTERLRLVEVEDLITRARYGECPCLRADGSIVVPGHLDLRKERRVPLGVTATVTHKRGQCRAIIKDISVSGMGLIVEAAIPLGMRVVARLPSGRELRGKVVSSNVVHTGVRLTTPLSENDLLLQTAWMIRRRQLVA